MELVSRVALSELSLINPIILTTYLWVPRINDADVLEFQVNTAPLPFLWNQPSDDDNPLFHHSVVSYKQEGNFRSEDEASISISGRISLL